MPVEVEYLQRVACQVGRLRLTIAKLSGSATTELRRLGKATGAHGYTQDWGDPDEGT
jgi:hypothetical protein